MKKQRQNFTRDLSIACSTDELRPVLNHVYFKDGYAYATDAHILIKQSLEYHTIIGKDNLEGRYLHRHIFKCIYGYTIAEATPDGVECTDKYGNKVLFRYSEFGDSKYPNADLVLDQFKPTQCERVAFGMYNLDKVRKLLYNENPDASVRFEFGEGAKSILKPNSCEFQDQVVLVMGCMMND